MSGDIINELSDPIIYPNWMWVAGVIILLMVILWVGFFVWRWWCSDEGAPHQLLTLSDARRCAYRELLRDIRSQRDSGLFDENDVFFAVAALMRSLGTERVGRDIEVATTPEVRQLLPMWPKLAEVIEACERGGFSDSHVTLSVEDVLQRAEEVIES